MRHIADARRTWIHETVRRLRSDSGANVMFEFAISLPLLVAMVVGTFAVGLMFDRSLTQGQLARNAANMNASGIRFNNNATKQLLFNAATGMNL
jgi:Flp pilus assembly protein TadG